MPRYTVYQQHNPIDTKRVAKDGTTIFAANLKKVKELIAPSAVEALKLAKQLPPFKYGTGRLRFPIIEDMDRN